MIRGINGFKAGFSIHCGPFWTPGSGYVVSLAERTQTFAQEPTAEQLAEFLVKNWDLLKLKFAILGGWSDEDTYYLDVNMLYQRKWAALRRGVFEGQKAIWDVRESRALPCEGLRGQNMIENTKAQPPVDDWA